jgi:hypothetical protein
MMTDFSGLKVWMKTDGKEWAATTDRSPYFWFLAPTKEAAIAQAQRALQFYRFAPSEVEFLDEPNGAAVLIIVPERPSTEA